SRRRRIGRGARASGVRLAFSGLLPPRLVSLVLAITADVVVLEVAGEIGGALLLEQSLEAAPSGIAGALAAPLGQVQVFDDLIEIDVAFLYDRLVVLFIFEFVRFGFLAHAGHRSPAVDGAKLKSDSLTS